MRDINLNNYEAWFLDFHEGNLNELQVVQLMAFLELHPGLKAELGGYEAIELTAEEEKISFRDKASLKKDPDAVAVNNFDETAVKYMEGGLNDVETKQLLDLVSKNSSLKKELELFQKTKLTADVSVVCDFKEELKHGKKRPALFYYWSVAASLAILLLSYFLLRTDIAESGKLLTATVNGVTVKKKTPRAIETVHEKNGHPAVYRPVSINSAAVNKKERNEISTENIIVAEHALAVVNTVNDSTLDPGKTDSVNVFYKNSYYEEMDAAIADVVPAKDSVLSLKENITSKIKTGLLKEEMSDEETYKEKKTRFTWYDAALLAAKGVKKITKKNVEVKKRYDQDDNLIAYEFTAGDKNFVKAVKK